MQDFICISILRFFGDPNDPRQMAKMLYPLQEIILVALCAAICGAGAFVEMEGFGNAKLDFLKRFLPFKNCIPSHDTFGDEIKAIPELLSMLSLKGALITIDAMGCQKEIAEKIIDKKADYFLAVEKNQKSL